ncbi:MAG: phosphate ABC transporter permease subunit PstC [Candidatus Methanofastidiosia archaeon]
MESPKRKLKEMLIQIFLFLNGTVAIISILLIFLFLLRHGLPALREIPLKDFFLGKIWQPVSDNPKYGILPLLSGTIVVTLTSLVIAVPIAIASAIYLGEFSGEREREIVKPFVEILSGIPSVILGFLALVVLGTYVQNIFHTTSRLNALTGSIILAVMLIPIILSISEDAINAVPKELREASLALGASKLQTTIHVVVPAAWSGIVAAVLLGVARVLGETMAVLMATGNAAQLTLNPLESVRTMTANIAIEMGEVPFGSVHFHALFAIGLVLFTITFVINFIADRIITKYREVGY